MNMSNGRRSTSLNPVATERNAILGQAGYKYKVELPPGFKCILEDLAREVMLKNPSDIDQFSADHFKRKLEERARDVGPFGFEEYCNADESCQPCTAEGSQANEEFQANRKPGPTGNRLSTQMAEPFRRQSAQGERKLTSEPQPTGKKSLRPPVSQLRKSTAYSNLAQGDNASLNQQPISFSKGNKHSTHQPVPRPSAEAHQAKESLTRNRLSRTSSQTSAVKIEDAVPSANSLPRRFDGSLVSDLEKGKKKSKSTAERQSIVDDVKVTRRSMLVADGPNGAVPRWSVAGKEPKEKPVECPQMPEPCRYVQPRTCRRNRPNEQAADQQPGGPEHRTKESNVQPNKVSVQRTAGSVAPRSDAAWPNTTLSKTYDRLPSAEEKRKSSDIRKSRNTSLGNFDQPPRESVTTDRSKLSRSGASNFGVPTEFQRNSRLKQSVESCSQNTAAVNLIPPPDITDTRKSSAVESNNVASRKSKGCKMPTNADMPPLPPPPPTLACKATIDTTQPSVEEQAPTGQNATRKKSSLIYSGPGASFRNSSEVQQSDSISKESAVPTQSKDNKRSKKSSKREKEIESFNDRFGGPHGSEQDLQEKPKEKKSSRFSAFFRRKKKRDSIPEEEGEENGETEDAKEGSPVRKDDRPRKSSGNRRSTVRSSDDPGPAPPSQPRQYSTLGPTSKKFSLLSKDRTDTPEEWVTSLSTNADSTPKTTVVTVTEKKITRYGSTASDTPDRDLESDDDNARRAGEKKSIKNKEIKKKSK